jgi:hypothetical protein
VFFFSPVKIKLLTASLKKKDKYMLEKSFVQHHRGGHAQLFFCRQPQFRNLKEVLPQSQFHNFKRQPNDSAEIDTQHGCSYRAAIPDFGWPAMLIMVQYQECVATGTWARLVLKLAEATSALTSPVRIFRERMRRAASALPTFGGKSGKSAGGRPGCQKVKQ